MYTPGPWKIVDEVREETHGYIGVRGPNDEKIADIFPFAAVGGVGVEAARANARLIAMAVDRQAVQGSGTSTASLRSGEVPSGRQGGDD